MNRKRILDWLVYFVVRVFIAVAQGVRIETGQSIARGLAWLFCDVLKIRGKVVEENLSHSFPGLTAEGRKRLARRMWEHLFLLVLEVAHTPRKIHETNWRDYVKLTNEDLLVRLLLQARPLLITTAHFGNFEVGGYVLGVLGFPTFTVARTLDNPYLDRFVNRFRSRTGQFIIPKNGGYDQIQAVLSNNGTMTFLADQYAGPKGCWIRFFNRPASAHKAIGLLCMEYDAVIAVSAATRDARPMHFHLHNYAMFDPRDAGNASASVKDMTQWYSSRLEELIAQNPKQYWWIHRRWKDTREPKKKKNSVES
jgi:Kdo2-lipid IVA lauroyltransferase/acyltransferase